MFQITRIDNKPTLNVPLKSKTRIRVSRGSTMPVARVGLFYSTSTGNTEAAAEWIQSKFSKHGEIAAPVDICETNVSNLEDYDSLIVGAPTWNTGADVGRSGTAWDDVMDEVSGLKLKGKKVAIFGCGDSVAYGDYFCDAIEELHSAVSKTGATLVGKTDTKDYSFEDSKAVVGGKFLGLPLDDDNEDDKTESRVEKWCAQLSKEGMK